MEQSADVVSKFTPTAGFDVADAIALLRLDDLYVEVFEVKDVKVWLGLPSTSCILQLVPTCLPFALFIPGC